MIDRFSRIAPIGQIGGDHRHNPDWAVEDLTTLKPASVLIGAIDRPAGRTLLLTQRSTKLRRHAGQIALPGGRAEPEDADAVVTALRETHEEVGISAAHLSVLGQLDPYSSRTGYLITAVLADVDPNATLTPQESEVAEIFEVPLEPVLDSANHRLETRVFEGRDRHYYRISTQDLSGKPREIWGVTAGILVELRRRLDAL